MVAEIWNHFHILSANMELSAWQNPWEPRRFSKKRAFDWLVFVLISPIRISSRPTRKCTRKCWENTSWKVWCRFLELSTPLLIWLMPRWTLLMERPCVSCLTWPTFIGPTTTSQCSHIWRLVPKLWRSFFQIRPFSPPNINSLSFWRLYSHFIWLRGFSCAFYAVENKADDFFLSFLFWEFSLWWNLRLWLHPLRVCSSFSWKKGRKIIIRFPSSRISPRKMLSPKKKRFFDQRSKKREIWIFLPSEYVGKNPFSFRHCVRFWLSPGYKHVLWKDVDIKIRYAHQTRPKKALSPAHANDKWLPG